MSWVCPEASSQLDMPRAPLKGGVQGASSPDAQTTSTGFSQLLYTEFLLDDWSSMRYLNSSSWGRTSIWTWRENSTIFQLLVSDVEVLSLIPAASHSAANGSSKSWRSSLDEANRTTSSAKSRSAILRSSNWNPSGPQLRLWIPSIKLMNRICDKGQPCRSPTLTGNKSN